MSWYYGNARHGSLRSVQMRGGGYPESISFFVGAICVPTPLTKNREPDLSYIVQSVQTISQHLKNIALLILDMQRLMLQDIITMLSQVSDDITAEQINAYPLRAIITNHYFHNRLVLVSDSAHIIHPLTGSWQSV